MQEGQEKDRGARPRPLRSVYVYHCWQALISAVYHVIGSIQDSYSYTGHNIIIVYL